MDDSKENKNSDVKLTDAIKKLLTAGVSAAFLTEESIRSYLGELKLPKEIIQTLLQSASKSKDELTSKVTQEMIAMIKKVDFVKEFSKFAENHKFKISAEIEVIKKEKNQVKE